MMKTIFFLAIAVCIAAWFGGFAALSQLAAFDTGMVQQAANLLR